MARQATYGSTLDALQQAGIAEEDQDLRSRTAGQGFLAQLAGERTRRRGTEADYDVGLRAQETGRLASERGLEAALASAAAQRDIAETYAAANRYQADKFAELDKAKLEWQKQLANMPKGMSEDMQLALMEKAAEEERAAKVGAAAAEQVREAVEPTGLEQLRAAGLALGSMMPSGQVAGPVLRYLTDWDLSPSDMRGRSRAAIKALKEGGQDTSRVIVNAKTGMPEVVPGTETFQQWLSRSNPNVFGKPESYAPYKGDVYVPKVGDSMPLPSPSTAGSKKRIPFTALKEGVLTTFGLNPVR